MMAIDEATSVTSVACKLQMLTGATWRNLLLRKFLCAYIICSLQLGITEKCSLISCTDDSPWSSPRCSIFSSSWGTLQILHHFEVLSYLPEILWIQGNILWECILCSKHHMVVTIPVLWKRFRRFVFIASCKEFNSSTLLLYAIQQHAKSLTQKMSLTDFYWPRITSGAL